jgi:hypothetical protein
LGFCLDIGGGCEVLLVSLWRMPPSRVLLFGANYYDEVLPLSLTLLVCYVWVLQIRICGVFFPNARKRLGKSKEF